MTHNIHDFHAMKHLAGSFHEAAHCVVGLKLGRTLERLTCYETKFVPKPDDTDVNRATVSFAGALAVATFDPSGRISADDSGDVFYRSHLTLSPADTELSRATAASIVEHEWQHICDVAFELDRAPTGQLDPQHVALLCKSMDLGGVP
jgi:hypothetical protein